MNKCFFIGRLTRDPVYSQSKSGKSVCRSQIAVARFKVSEEAPDTDFFALTAYGNAADIIAKHARCGELIAVCGSVHIDKFDGDDGEQKTVVRLDCNEVELLPNGKKDKKKSDDEDFEDYNELPDSIPRGKKKQSKKPFMQSFNDDEDAPF